MQTVKITAKDFIETIEGLIFAVVIDATEHNKVLCFLRYIKTATGYKKLSSEQANLFLQEEFPEYLYFSRARDVKLHAVSLSSVVKHFRPKQRLQTILRTGGIDTVEQDTFKLCQLFSLHGVDLDKAGITGSILIGQQNPASDVDLLIYDRSEFHRMRAIISQLIASEQLQGLAEDDWQTCYARRACALGLKDYIWHEQRKLNKALINGRKFDLNLLIPTADSVTLSYKKLGPITLRATVVGDDLAFDYPAVFAINHQKATRIVCYTATYLGQAIKGEMIEVSGQLEQSTQGEISIVVGSTREAVGEYIKVI